MQVFHLAPHKFPYPYAMMLYVQKSTYTEIYDHSGSRMSHIDLEYGIG